MKKELSAGIIFTDGNSILGCRPFGRKDEKGNYDLPKGHVEPGENPAETAIRETEEETGFKVWEGANLVNLGHFKYIPTKDLHLFLLAMDAIPDPTTLKCKSTFNYRGVEVPEVLGYKLIPIEELDWFFESLTPVVERALDVFSTLKAQTERAEKELE